MSFSLQLLAQAPFSDTFSDPTLNPGWRFETPNPDSSYDMTGSSININASWNDGGSDLYGEDPDGPNFAAPRLLQPVDPSLDWIIETGFSFSPTDNYQDAGLLLADTNGMFSSGADFDRIAMRAYYPDAGGNVIRSVGSYVAYSGGTSYLRVQKRGANYTGWWSSDGVNWTLNGTTTMTNIWSYFGLVVIRYPWDGVEIDSSASFYYFDVTVNGINVAPVLTVPGTQTVYATTTLMVTNTATESDIWATSLTFALVSAPSGVMLNPNTGVLTWTPTVGQVGTNTIYVSATDYDPNAENSQFLSSTNSFSVIVNGLSAPSFNQQPSNDVVNLGQGFTFSSQATGYPAPTYQWQFSTNGSDYLNISGATAAIYSLTSSDMTNIGYYRVLAANSVNTNASTSVSLTLLNPELLT